MKTHFSCVEITVCGKDIEIGGLYWQSNIMLVAVKLIFDLKNIRWKIQINSFGFEIRKKYWQYEKNTSISN